MMCYRPELASRHVFPWQRSAPKKQPNSGGQLTPWGSHQGRDSDGLPFPAYTGGAGTAPEGFEARLWFWALIPYKDEKPLSESIPRGNMDPITPTILKCRAKSILLQNPTRTITLISFPATVTAAYPEGSRRGRPFAMQTELPSTERRAGCGCRLRGGPAFQSPVRANGSSYGTRATALQDRLRVFDYCFRPNRLDCRPSNGSVTKALPTADLLKRNALLPGGPGRTAIPKCTPGCSLLTMTQPACRRSKKPSGRLFSIPIDQPRRALEFTPLAAPHQKLAPEFAFDTPSASQGRRSRVFDDYRMFSGQPRKRFDYQKTGRPLRRCFISLILTPYEFLFSIVVQEGTDAR